MFKERFEDKYVAEPNTGCWLWTSATSHGYGRFSIKNKNYAAHRVAYELYKEPIPEGLHIDHLCRTPACVNPDHMEPVTNKENCRRGKAVEANRARQLAKTHCKNGHLLSGENLYMQPSNGQRVCRTCTQARKRKWRAVNPGPGKNLEGLKLGAAASAEARRTKPFCKFGHPLSGENLSISSSNGQRICKTCRRVKEQRRRDNIKGY